MPTSIPGARANLFAALAAAPWPSPAPQVTYGSPDAYEDQQVVAMLGFSPVDDDPAAIGQRRQEEAYRIEVKIKVHDPAAATGRSVEVRSMALYDVAWNVVIDNPDLGGAVTFCHPSGAEASDGPLAAEGGGWVMFVSIFVACTARIAREP